MAKLTIRNVDDETVARLQARAKANGRSLQAELRLLLTRRAACPSSGVLMSARARGIATLTNSTPQTDSAELVWEDRRR